MFCQGTDDYLLTEEQLYYSEKIFRENNIEDHAIYSMNNRLVNTFYTQHINIHDFSNMQKEAINNVPGLVGMSIIYNNVGVAYLYCGHPDEAIRWFTKGLDYSRDRVVQNLGLKTNILIAKGYSFEKVEEREIRLLINTIFDNLGIDRLPFISANYVMNALSVSLRYHPGLAHDLIQDYPIEQLLQNAFKSNILGSGSLSCFLNLLMADFPEFKISKLSYPRHMSNLSGIRANFLINHGYNPAIFNAWL